MSDVDPDSCIVTGTMADHDIKVFIWIKDHQTMRFYEIIPESRRWVSPEEYMQAAVTMLVHTIQIREQFIQARQRLHGRPTLKVRRLIAQLDSDIPAIRARSILAIDNLRATSPMLVHSLLQRLRIEQNVTLRQLLTSILILWDVQDIHDVLFEQFKQGLYGMQEWVEHGMWANRDPRAAGVVDTALKDPDPNVRRKAVAILGSVFFGSGYTNPWKSQWVDRVAMLALSDPEPSVRQETIKSLRSMLGLYQASMYFMNKIESRENATMINRLCAIEAAAQLLSDIPPNARRSAPLTNSLYRTARDDPDETIRLAATRALANVPPLPRDDNREIWAFLEKHKAILFAL